MKRTEFIRRTLAALFGTKPVTLEQRNLVAGMADRVAEVYLFDREQ